MQKNYHSVFNGQYASLAFAVILVTCVPALGQVTPPIPHNDVLRPVPTVPILPPTGPAPNVDWWSECVAIGSCADYGIGCPQPPSPLPPLPTWALWCDSLQTRDACERVKEWVSCTTHFQPKGCGKQWTGLCLTSGLVNVNSVVWTGLDCPALKCFTN